MSSTRKPALVIFLTALVLGTFAPGNAAADAYEDALARFRSDDYKGAIVTLKSALQEEPRNLSALVLLGRAFLKVGNGAGAEDALRRARANGADSAIIIVPLGRALLAQGKYNKVLEEFSDLGQDKSLQVEILVLKGDALFALDRLQEAREMFNTASAIDPTKAAPRTGIARLSLAAGQPAIAAARSARAVLLDADDSQAWFINAEAQRLQGKLDDALQSYGRALALDPRYEDAQVARAAVLIDLKRVPEALADIELVQERNPRQPQASYLKALLLSRQGKLDEAAEILTKMAGLLEGADQAALNKSAPMLLLAGVVANAQGNAERARAHLQRFIALQPNHTLARRLLGEILVRQGEGRLAIDVLTPALGQAANDSVMHATLGIAYRQANLYKESVTALARAVELSPSAPSPRIELVRSRLAAGQPLTAARELEEIVKAGGKTAAIAGILLTQLRVEQDDLPGALNAARGAVQGDPSNLQAHLVLGDILVRTGDPMAAGGSYERALAINPNSQPALFAMGNAEIRQGKLKAAAARYETMLTEEPTQQLAMMGLALVAEAEGRITDAVRWLEKARSTDNRVTAPQMALVKLHLRHDQSSEAVRAASKLADSAPADVRAAQMLARAQVADGDRQRAKSTYRNIMGMAGITADQLTAVARSQMALEDFEGARKTLDTARASAPFHLLSQATMVALDLVEKRFDEAMSRAETVRKQFSKLALGPLLVGDVLSATGAYALAARAYEEALSLKPAPLTKVKLFRARWRADRKDEAIAGIDAWLAAEPDNPVPQRQLAEAYLAAGKLDKAQGLHERLLLLVPEDTNLMNNLAWIYQKRSDPRALATAQRAAALAPEQASVLDTYGWILLESGQPEQALKILRKAQARAATNPWVNYHTALALSHLGQNAEARELLLALLASGVAFEYAQEARALLNRLPEG